jgi:hypothetical protein
MRLHTAAIIALAVETSRENRPTGKSLICLSSPSRKKILVFI